MLDDGKDGEVFIDLGDVDGIPHPQLFATVSKVIAEDTLQYVNLHDKAVIPRSSFYTKYGKRIADIVISVFALIMTFPVNLVLALCTFIDVGKPILFKQKRTGLKGKSFTLAKLRNMTNEVDENGILLPPSQRVTKLGRFVRRTSLDELLNFWNILKGDMSLIGPRPLLTDYMEIYSERHKMRHFVRPGLECPVVCRTMNRSTWAAQFENDIYYVENVSLLLDIKMVFALVKMVFDKNGTDRRGNANCGSFMGYNRDGSSIDSKMVPLHYYQEAVERMGYKVQQAANW